MKLRFSNGFADTLEILDDSLTTTGLAYPWILTSDALADTFRLEDGRRLRLDLRTRPGRYVLQDGRILVVGQRVPQGRSMSLLDAPRPALHYRVRSPHRVGVWIRDDSMEGATHPGDLSEFRARLGASGPWPRPIAEVPLAYELPRDWYPHADLEWRHDRPRRVRVTWVTFADEAPTPPDPTAWPAHREPARVKGRKLAQRLGFGPFWLAPDSTAFARTARVLGEVIVDPASRSWRPVNDPSVRSGASPTDPTPRR